MHVSAVLDAYAQRGTNCAQAVLRGFQHVFAIPEERIGVAAAHGGGRAPEGRCGALHSALELLETEADRQAMQEEFQRQAGAVTCREVRSLRRLSCQDCVRLAAVLVQDRLSGR